MDSDIDIEKLVSDRKAFHDFVYTPLDEAIVELTRRWNDKTVKDIPELPEIFKTGFNAVLFRHIATSNFEVMRFMMIDDALSQLNALILEYTGDMFTNGNDSKYSLGKLSFYKGREKTGALKVENQSIIDFNTSNGNPISSLKTLWGQSLVDFHHELFLRVFKNGQKNIYDLTNWLHKNGETAKKYYTPFFLLFIKNGILFDNFLLNQKEISFTKEIILKSFIQAKKKAGLKPLIVSLEPTSSEEDHFWLCHPYENKQLIRNKLKTLKSV